MQGASGPSPNCRYPLDDSESRSATLALPDGRKMGYACYGDPNGIPIIYVPGYPSSRIDGALLHPEALKTGAFIICVDRPGYGLSSPHEKRTLLSFAKDIEALTEHLGLERYGVLGVSGGGPYALACAKSLPADGLRGVAIVCGLGARVMGYWGMSLPNYVGWTFGQRWFSRLCNWWMSQDPGAKLDLEEGERFKLMQQNFEKGRKNMHPKDAAMFGDPDFMWMHIRRSAQTWVQGTDGVAGDFKVLSEDFEFRIEDIRKDIPVMIWHGRLDTNVPLQHAQKTAARLGNNARLTITDDTHGSIFNERKEEFLRDLVDTIRA